MELELWERWTEKFYEEVLPIVFVLFVGAAIGFFVASQIVRPHITEYELARQLVEACIADGFFTYDDCVDLFALGRLSP